MQRPVPSLKILIPILAMLSAFAPVATDMYLPGMSIMAQALQTTPGMMQASIAVFFLGIAIGQSIYGPLIDHFGRKPLLLLGIGVYALASLGCIFVTQIEWFLALRFLQAIGGSAGMLIGRAIINDLFDRTETARVFSLLLMITILAPILAPIGGGWLVYHVSWQSIFWFMLFFSLACLGLVSWQIPETLTPQKRQPLSFGNTFRVYAALLHNPRFMIPALSGALVQGCIFAFITGSEFVFTQLFGLTAQQYSWLFALGASSVILSNSANRMALKRWPVEKVFAAGLLVNAAFGLCLLLAATSGKLWLFAVPLWLVIATLGFVGANGMAMSMAASGTNAGSGSGLIGVLQFAMAFAVSSLVAASQNGTIYPLALAMCLCGLSGCLLWFTQRHKALSHAPGPDSRG